MADDQQNPYTQMGMLQMMMPNPYTQYKGQLPMPGFRGTPTDATGQPIQSFLDAQSQHDAWAAANPAQGTTLNSTPGLQRMTGPQLVKMANDARTAAGIDPTTGVASNQGSADQAAYYRQMAQSLQPRSPITGPTGSGRGSEYDMNPRPSSMFINPGAASGGSTTPAPTNPVDMRQAYLDALAKPGDPQMPGATVQPSAPLGQPSVLNSFLAANPSGGGTGAGNYNNSGFFNTLNKLRSA